MPHFESWPKAVLANSRAAPPSRLVLVTLAAGCSPDGVCGIPLAKLASFTGLSKRGVQNALADLIRLGELILHREPVGRSRAIYRIEISRLYNFQSSTTRYSTESVEWHGMPLKKADLLTRARAQQKHRPNVREPRTDPSPSNITPFPTLPSAAEA